MAERIDGFIKAFPDNPALFYGNGRLLQYCIFNEGTDIRQIIDLTLDFHKKLRIKILQRSLNMGKHLQGLAECNQIPWICRFIAYFSKQTLQVIYGIQILPYLIPVHGFLAKRFHCV